MTYWEWLVRWLGRPIDVLGAALTSDWDAFGRFWDALKTEWYPVPIVMGLVAVLLAC